MASAMTVSYAEPENLHTSGFSFRFEEDSADWIQRVKHDVECEVNSSGERQSCFHLFHSLCLAPVFLVLQVPFSHRLWFFITLMN